MNNDIICISFPGKSEYILMAKLAVSAIAVKMDLSIDDIEDIKIASQEGCSMLLKYSPEFLKIDITLNDNSFDMNISSEEFNKGQKCIEENNEFLTMTVEGERVTGVYYRKNIYTNNN